VIDDVSEIVPKSNIVATNCGMAPMHRDIAEAKLNALGGAVRNWQGSGLGDVPHLSIVRPWLVPAIHVLAAARDERRDARTFWREDGASRLFARHDETIGYVEAHEIRLVALACSTGRYPHLTRAMSKAVLAHRAFDRFGASLYPPATTASPRAARSDSSASPSCHHRAIRQFFHRQRKRVQPLVAAVEPLALKHRVDIACGEHPRRRCALPRGAKPVGVVAAAEETRTMPTRARLPRRERTAHPAARAHQPWRRHPLNSQRQVSHAFWPSAVSATSWFWIVNDAAIAGKHAAMRGGDDFACWHNAGFAAAIAFDARLFSRSRPLRGALATKQSSFISRSGLLRGACHRARIRATVGSQ